MCDKVDYSPMYNIVQESNKNNKDISILDLYNVKK